jgi:hypothetical protein
MMDGFGRYNVQSSGGYHDRGETIKKIYAGN